MRNNFLPIPVAPGYEINSQGFVKNARTGRILKPYKPKDRPTAKIHIPKYHVRQTAESLRRQAVTAHKENNRETSFEIIPNTNGLYEINYRGVVRNVKTKRILKTRFCKGMECVALSVNGKAKNRGIKSLLWEVHGIIKSKQPSVKIIKEKEHYRFQFQKDCIKFLCKRENYSYDYVRKKLSARVKNFCGWQIFYREIE